MHISYSTSLAFRATAQFFYFINFLYRRRNTLFFEAYICESEWLTIEGYVITFSVKYHFKSFFIGTSYLCFGRLNCVRTLSIRKSSKLLKKPHFGC